jgi:hypothetical protein
MVAQVLPPTQGKFGIAAFDISNDDDRSEVWDELAGKVIRATKSVLIFDLAFKDEVQAVLARCTTGAKDMLFPPIGLTDEVTTRLWVRNAMEALKDETIRGFKRTVDRAESELKEKKLGVLDLMDRSTDALKRIEKRIEDFYVAACTFRMGDEFVEFRRMISAALDVEQGRVAIIVGMNADQLARETAELARETKAA